MESAPIVVGALSFTTTSEETELLYYHIRHYKIIISNIYSTGLYEAQDHALPAVPGDTD